MKSAGQKLNFARATLQGVDKSIRDDQGFSYTANRILSATENLMDNMPGNASMINEAFAEGMNRYFSRSKNNFSATDLQSVYDMDVVDISIAATVASHGLTYVAMERAMHSVRQNIEFQKLVAINNAGGFIKGQTVVDPRLALSATVDLGRNGAKKELVIAEESGEYPEGVTVDGTTVTAELGLPLVAGTTELVWTEEESGSAAAEPKVVAFTSTALKPEDGVETVLIKDGSKIKSAKVTLADGKIEIEAGEAVDGKLSIVYCVDRIAESDGANTLKLRPQLDSKEITATENRIILQTSVEVQAQMNKIYRENSQYGVDVDYGKRAIDQVVMLYTYYIDLNVIRALWEGAKNLPFSASISLSGYATPDYTSFAATKNDRIAHFVRTLCSAMLSKTGLAVTALVVDEQGALMLASDAENFKDEPAFRQRRDGLVGYYNNIPVIRNVYLNDKVETNHGIVLGVHKSLNGEAAPVAFGEYLSPYSTIAAVNPMNPGELSQALFSQTATECVVPEFIVKGDVTVF